MTPCKLYNLREIESFILRHVFQYILFSLFYLLRVNIGFSRRRLTVNLVEVPGSIPGRTKTEVSFLNARSTQPAEMIN